MHEAFCTEAPNAYKVSPSLSFPLTDVTRAECIVPSGKGTDYVAIDFDAVRSAAKIAPTSFWWATIVYA